MFAFRNLRIGTKLSLLVVMSVIGFAIFTVYAFYTLGVVRVNGPIYQGLAQDQELVADVLPPPSYIIETHLVASLMLDSAEHQGSQSIDTLIEKATALQTEYEARHAYWTKVLPSNTNKEITQALLVDSYQAAETYFRVFNDQFVPAIRSGQVENADVIFHKQLIPAYETHRASIDKVVALQKTAIQVNESGAQSLISRSTSLLIFLAILTIGIVIGLSIFISRSITLPVRQLTHVANQIIGGELNAQASSETTDEVGILAGAFNSMTSQLRDMLASLEQRVAARTKDLATVARVSTNTATILDPERMLETAVHLTQRGFGLYHAHVFTYEKEQEHLQIVACGYKEGDEHEGTHGTTVIPLHQEQSLVARAARTRKPVIVNDVHNEPGWLPNPLLPDTQSELAVPMIVGDQLLGVLDVQSDKLNAFSDEDANIQMTLAAQIATALKNAQSFTEAKSRADIETIINTISQKIQRATTVEDTLQVAIRELGTAIGASRVKANLALTRQSEHSN